MATITPTVVGATPTNHEVLVISWALGNADSGAAIEYAQFADRSIQFSGTFGGATVVWEGSNDGTNYQTLHDALPTNGTLSFTSADFRQIFEVSKYARPRTSGGAGTAIVATLAARR